MAEIDNRMESLGKYKDGELNAFMSNVDCTVAPSIWWENSPLTVLTRFSL